MAAIVLPFVWSGAALAGLAVGITAELGWLAVALLIVFGVLVAVGVRLHASVMSSLAALTGLVHGLDNAAAFVASDSGLVAGVGGP